MADVALALTITPPVNAPSSVAQPEKKEGDAFSSLINIGDKDTDAQKLPKPVKLKAKIEDEAGAADVQAPIQQELPTTPKVEHILVAANDAVASIAEQPAVPVSIPQQIQSLQANLNQLLSGFDADGKPIPADQQTAQVDTLLTQIQGLIAQLQQAQTPLQQPLSTPPAADATALSQPQAASNTALLQQLQTVQQALQGFKAQQTIATADAAVETTPVPLPLELREQLGKLKAALATPQKAPMALDDAAKTDVKTNFAKLVADAAPQPKDLAEKPVRPELSEPVNATPAKQPPATPTTPQPAAEKTAKPLEKVEAPKPMDNDAPQSASPVIAAAPAQQADASTPNFLKLVAVNTAAPQQPVVDQVKLVIQQNAAEGLRHIELQLHPADLGKLKIELNITHDGKTQVAIAADNPDTLALLQKDSRMLQQALEQVGFKSDAGSMNFSLSQQGQEQPGKQQAFQHYQKGTEIAQTEVVEEILAQPQQLALVEGLDITI